MAKLAILVEGTAAANFAKNDGFLRCVASRLREKIGDKTAAVAGIFWRRYGEIAKKVLSE